MVYYAVIDTNVLVSALLSSHDDTATVLILNKLFSGEVIPLFNKEILEEYNDVLHRPKFHFQKIGSIYFLKLSKSMGNMLYRHLPEKYFQI